MRKALDRFVRWVRSGFKHTHTCRILTDYDWDFEADFHCFYLVVCRDCLQILYETPFENDAAAWWLRYDAGHL